MQTAKILSVEILYEQEMLVESDNLGKNVSLSHKLF